MKRPLSILTIYLTLIIGCKKEENRLINEIPVEENTALIALAGKDTTIKLYLNYIMLNGFCSPVNTLNRFEWKKLEGPNCLFENSNSLQTRVSDLQIGVYRFELTVYDRNNLNARDTVAVTAISPNHTSPFYANNLTWIFPWYNSLEVMNFYGMVPLDRPIKVFVQRSFDPSWIEAFPVSTTNNNNTYEYFIANRINGGGMYTYGSLYVLYYGTNTTDRPNVKIEF